MMKQMSGMMGGKNATVDSSFRLDLNKFLYFIFYFRRNKQNGSKIRLRRMGYKKHPFTE